MQMLIWAFGSMLVIMIIFSFLPLGFTIKGRLIIGLTGFVLALGGLAAATAFPLWETSLMLVVLIFFTAYIMQSRMGAFLYKENPLFTEEFNDEDVVPVHGGYNEVVKNDMLLEIAETEILATSFVNLEVKSKINNNPISENTKVEQEENNLTEIVDEDISFLLDRNVATEVEENSEDIESKSNYLSDIESMLAENELEEKIKDSDDDWLDELSPINKAATLSDKENEQEEKLLDDSLSNIYTATREVAAGKAVDGVESQLIKEPIK
jgi:hypothetical protein